MSFEPPDPFAEGQRIVLPQALDVAHLEPRLLRGPQRRALMGTSSPSGKTYVRLKLGPFTGRSAALQAIPWLRKTPPGARSLAACSK